ncbi:hypothetical protein FHU29_002599 [Hoyosella altamirensis]|uniref:Uncharacterized protein n=1 Tax=Hoyosella altamirensis TaxID=616997 RepID=A0A839RNS2_9ACTN|nr:hypothetical protein [Hoyosella altamirensis]
MLPDGPDGSARSTLGTRIDNRKITCAQTCAQFVDRPGAVCVQAGDNLGTINIVDIVSAGKNQKRAVDTVDNPVYGVSLSSRISACCRRMFAYLQ